MKYAIASLLVSLVCTHQASAETEAPLVVSRFDIRPGEQVLKLPKDGFILSASIHEGRLSVFTGYTPGSEQTKDTFVHVVPSESPVQFGPRARFISTVVDGTQAWHVFADN